MGGVAGAVAVAAAVAGAGFGAMAVTGADRQNIIYEWREVTMLHINVGLFKSDQVTE